MVGGKNVKKFWLGGKVGKNCLGKSEKKFWLEEKRKEVLVGGKVERNFVGGEL